LWAYTDADVNKQMYTAFPAFKLQNQLRMVDSPHIALRVGSSFTSRRFFMHTMQYIFTGLALWLWTRFVCDSPLLIDVYLLSVRNRLILKRGRPADN